MVQKFCFIASGVVIAPIVFERFIVRMKFFNINKHRAHAQGS